MKRIISLVLTLCLALSTASLFAGCGEPVDESKVLRIELSNAGFGIGWADPLIDIFEAEHPGITVEKTFLTKKDNEMVDKALSGLTDLDIIFPESTGILAKTREKIKINGENVEPFVELSDIIFEKIPGEDVTIAEKMNEQWFDYQTTIVGEEEYHYLLPWMQSPIGIVVNLNLYSEAAFGKLPNTTDEMFAFADNVKNSGISPFIHCIDDTYWDVMYDVWMNQYYGVEATRKFYNGYAIDGSARGQRYVPQMAELYGYYYALEVLDRLVDPVNAYMHEYSSKDFTSVQNFFLEPEKDPKLRDVMFMPNGAWLEREMEANYAKGEVNVEFIKTPVVSALGSARLGLTAPGKTADEVLSEIITWIDDGKTGAQPTFSATMQNPDTGSVYTVEECLAIVEDARNITPAFNGYNGAIPACSNQIPLAKEFLQLMASDRGIEAMLKNCGSMPPYKYEFTKENQDDLELSDFMYSVNVLAQKGYAFAHQDALFTLGGYRLNATGVSPTAAFRVESTDPIHQTVEDFYGDNIAATANNWQNYLSFAGLN